jgi:NAD(P)-dependent dehydrogenase (short-subunit alcohol dehydrogenase family)
MAKQLSSLLQPGLPVDVAELTLFLGSAEGRALSGQLLRCDGGMFLGA